MRTFSGQLGAWSLPGMAAASTGVPWPVWRNSTAAKARYQPMTRQDAARLYHRLRDFERQTRRPGRQDGALGRNGLRITEALLFDFLNFRTGRLDPSYEAIARKANIAVRSVARGLNALCAAGVLHWQRRCRPVVDQAGRCTLEQETNAYGVCPPTQWKGYAALEKARAPDTDSWGAAPAVARGTVESGTFDREYELIELDALAKGGDQVAAALLRLSRLPDQVVRPDVPELRRNIPML